MKITDKHRMDFIQRWHCVSHATNGWRFQCNLESTSKSISFREVVDRHIREAAKH